jgi:hypothetical protein
MRAAPVGAVPGVLSRLEGAGFVVDDFGTRR